MTITTVQDVLAIARDRGFEVRVVPGPPAMPVLHCPAGCDKSLATPALLAALKAWRVEIIEALQPKREE